MEKEKINISKLLKDCPKGMELDSPVWDNIVFEEIDKNDIIIYRKSRDAKVHLTQYGEVNTIDEKCVIFPKGKTTWEGFVPPCQFKDGDIISNDNYIAIFYKIGTPCGCTSPNVVYYHCYYSQKFCKFKKELDFGIGISTEFKYATEEEKQKLFDTIKANGYKWNAETKTLEKLVEPMFKVGDRIVHKKEGNPFTITEITDGCYKGGTRYAILITQQDNFELAPDKFDINTLVPFESKVLVRDNDYDEWKGSFWGYLRQKADIKYDTMRGVYRQCIPYNDDTKHLLGKTTCCEDYYKNW